MAGYNYAAGMSNNAVDAYDGGRKPLSRLTAADLRAAGVALPLVFAKWLAGRGWWQSSEWHHSGGTWYNKVTFYDPAELAEAIADAKPGEVTALFAEFKASKATKAAGDGVRVRGSFAVFGGSARRRRYLGRQAFVGTLVGSWIFLDDGGKKRADTDSIEWQELTAADVAAIAAARLAETQRAEAARAAQLAEIQRAEALRAEARRAEVAQLAAAQLAADDRFTSVRAWAAAPSHPAPSAVLAAKQASGLGWRAFIRAVLAS